MDILHYFLLIVGGIFTGFFNVLFGGGGLISLPVYMGVGLTASVANGTNRVNLIFQNITAIYRFSRKGKMPWKLGLIYGIPTTIGVIGGAMLATNISDLVLHITLMVIVVFSFLYVLFYMNKGKNIKCSSPDRNIKKISFFTLFLFLIVGFYAGFIQVAIGMIWYFLFSWRLKYSFVTITALKILLSFIVCTVALIIFIIAGKVNFIDGIVLGVGGGIGAWIASNMAMKLKDKTIKVIILSFLSVAGLYTLLFKLLHLF